MTSQRKRLHIRERGSLDNLELRPAERKPPGPGQLEIEVDITALSFRDVLNVLGMYPGDPGPVGGECAGRVASLGKGVTTFNIGDEVVAIASGAHDGYVLAHDHMAARRPASLNLEDALTFPSSFMTAVFTLEHLAGIRAGQRALIHAGTGGVGLAAVQIAQRAGAEIFATAGSDEKRAYLRSLGVPHTMSSRNADFVEYIRRETAGHGADIVLNSLANDLLEASFEVIAHGGVFLEIGKNGIWTQQCVEQLGKSICYHIVDWSENARDEPELIHSLLTRIMDDAGAGRLKPLPKRVFAFEDAAEAFRHMARARHIGRVLLRQQDPDCAIRSEGTYVVVGDLRGEGLQAAQWLAEKGARNLMLLDAAQPPPEAFRFIRSLARQGIRVTPARIEDCGRVLAQAAEVRGVIHGEHVSPEHLQKIYEAIAVAPLDFFSVFAPCGTSPVNAAAHGITERLAHTLRSRGIRADALPGASEDLVIKNGTASRMPTPGI